MIFPSEGLESFLKTVVKNQDGGEVLIKQIKQGVALPAEKFRDAFSGGMGNGSLKSALYYLAQFVQIYVDKFAMFRMTNYLVTVTNGMGEELKKEGEQIYSEWKTRVGAIKIEDMVQIAAKSDQIEEKIMEQLVLDLLDSAYFPQEKNSWSVALPFLKRKNPIPSDKKFLTKTTALLMENLSLKGLSAADQSLLLQILALTVTDDTKVDDIKKFLLQIVKNEGGKVEWKQHHEVSLLILKTVELKVFSPTVHLPVECVQYLSNQESSITVLDQSGMFNYSLEILNNSTDPICISAISALFLHPPQGGLDSSATSTIISVFTIALFPADNSVYANLSKAVKAKGADGKIQVTEKTLSSIISVVNENIEAATDKRKLTIKQINNLLGILAICGENVKNFDPAQKPGDICKVVGDVCMKFINKTTDNGKSLPEEDLIVKFLSVFENFTLLGYPLSSDNYKLIYNVLSLKDFPRNEAEGNALSNFLSVSLDKLKFAKDLLDWDIGLVSVKADPKGVLLSSIARNIGLDQLSAIALMVSAIIVNFGDGPSQFAVALGGAVLLEKKRETLAEYLKRMIEKKVDPIMKERKKIIFNLLATNSYKYFPEPEMGETILVAVCDGKKELDLDDLQFISAYVREKNNSITEFTTVKAIFSLIKDKSEAYESGYADLFDIHKEFIRRFADKITKDTADDWATWWSAYIVNEVDREKQVAERIKCAVDLLLLIPYKEGSKTELNVNKWDHIKELLDKLIASTTVDDVIKGNIKAVYAKIGVK